MSMISNALSGLNAANVAMIVAGQNVANAAVDSYSRQTARFETVGSPLGGVNVSSVERIVDAFLNDDIWRTSSDLGYYQGKQSYLGYIEQVIGTDSLNFNDGVGEISNALNAAATKPDSLAYRQQVIATSESLLQDLAQMDGALEGQISKLSLEMSNLGLNTSSTTAEIAEVNHQITQAQAKNLPTAELKDNRERLVGELSKSIGIAVIEHDDGSIDISTLSGAPLVIGNKAAKVSVSGTTVTATLLNQSFKLTEQVGGRFGGLISADTQVIQPTLDSLNSLVKNFADDINTALAQGFDLNGDAGIDLFEYNPLNPLGSITINPGMTAEKLALTGNELGLPSGGPGDNGNVANIVSAIANSGSAFTYIVGDLAISSKQNQNSIATSVTLNDSAILARDSISGVNLDEEAASLMHFQQMYNANAKVITTADQIFDSLLNMF
ncbi:flagellar hook-associated protein FlgK [Pseudoalteromonas shioyasakiensis]|uniref:flagellar hook-associated protein FlgK n=1 Tax=Pseudoalteromonas shioyasakiensis TaxID=1190813 RepID=UPI0021199617|nr:flagellar hook-associated protein FlgK [Pseudoalteromonas shioyasakiensis]MCQ8877510.1 flagellar hook-associated protein FlgK [Pseudoalteromonas shioyasakiensis]